MFTGEGHGFLNLTVLFFRLNSISGEVLLRYTVKPFTFFPFRISGNAFISAFSALHSAQFLHDEDLSSKYFPGSVFR